ncbi:hypothetical protein Pmani_025995 [Petrolisthes manimaculis]|uniref:Uncharacterized protein n=1 Tax=Petrolisthes manimaculis TaxID=1843537 RepID=A0AAE1P731_9EUCA|nr:hypothetical protein Pmani_025995 [Petrolisthes manimaculis]
MLGFPWSYENDCARQLTCPSVTPLLALCHLTGCLCPEGAEGAPKKAEKTLTKRLYPCTVYQKMQVFCTRILGSVDELAAMRDSFSKYYRGGLLLRVFVPKLNAHFEVKTAG